MHPTIILLSAAVATGGVAPATTASPSPVTQLSPDRAVNLTSRLVPEKPTVFLFFRPGSTMERELAQSLEKAAGGKAGLLWVSLKTGAEPLAKRHGIVETPTAIVYDRRGRLVSRTSSPDEMRSALRHALGVMRIDWAADDDPRMAEVAKILGRRPPGGIMRTMSLQPEWLGYINALARKAHFADGALDRRTKEMIATYVSGLNDCKF